MSRVYVSLPVAGPSGAAGREVLRGVDLAQRPRSGVEIVALDASGDHRDALAAEHARRAAADPVALARAIDKRGHTTSTAYACLAVVDGEWAWDRA